MFKEKAEEFIEKVKTLAESNLNSSYIYQSEKLNLMGSAWVRISFINPSKGKSLNFCLFEESENVELTITDENDRNLDSKKLVEKNSIDGILLLMQKILN